MVVRRAFDSIAADWINFFSCWFIASRLECLNAGVSSKYISLLFRSHSRQSPHISVHYQFFNWRRRRITIIIHRSQVLHRIYTILLLLPLALSVCSSSSATRALTIIFRFSPALILHYVQQCDLSINRSSIPTGSTFFASFSFVVNAVMHWCAISARRSAAVVADAAVVIMRAHSYCTWHISFSLVAVLWTVPARKWSETHHRTIFLFDSLAVPVCLWLRCPRTHLYRPTESNYNPYLFLFNLYESRFVSFHLRFPPFVHIKMLFSTWNIFVIERIKRNLDKVPRTIYECVTWMVTAAVAAATAAAIKSQMSRARDRRESALLVHRTFGTRNETKKINVFRIFQFSIFGVAFRLKEEFRCFIGEFIS